jgi:hypothetical protein
MFSHPQGSKVSVRSHHILYILAHCIPVKYIESPFILPFIGGVAIHSSTSFTNPKKQKDMTQGGAPLKVFQPNLAILNSKESTKMGKWWFNGELMVILSGWWFGTMDFYDFPFSWEYSSQLTNSYFSEG